MDLKPPAAASPNRLRSRIDSRLEQGGRAAIQLFLQPRLFSAALRRLTVASFQVLAEYRSSGLSPAVLDWPQSGVEVRARFCLMLPLFFLPVHTMSFSRLPLVPEEAIFRGTGVSASEPVATLFQRLPITCFIRGAVASSPPASVVLRPPPGQSPLPQP